MATGQKKVYQRPILVKYGELKDLTAGGSANAKENGQSQPAKRV
jgi:hypothetical protein